MNVELATALALVEASANGDDEAFELLLTDVDLRSVAAYLAYIAVDLLADLDTFTGASVPAMLAVQRSAWLEAGDGR
jgi:hypothetical protein